MYCSKNVLVIKDVLAPALSSHKICFETGCSLEQRCACQSWHSAQGSLCRLYCLTRMCNNLSVLAQGKSMLCLLACARNSVLSYRLYCLDLVLDKLWADCHRCRKFIPEDKRVNSTLNGIICCVAQFGESGMQSIMYSLPDI